jgi:glycine/D-amino acid oxidase-like deaminating enzyme
MGAAFKTGMKQDVKAHETWYEATASRGPARPPLAGRVAADVCVIGGGLAGLTVARELQRRGKQTVLLEANRIAWGASGRNGGSVSHGFSEAIGAIARRHGTEQARALHALSAEGTAYIARAVAAHDPSLKFGEGAINAWRHPGRDAALRHIEIMHRDFGHALELIGREELRLFLRSERYQLGIRDAAAFHIHPLRYALLVAARAEKDGARIFENSKALEAERAGGAYRIRCAEGEATAEHVVFCVSSLDRRIHPPTGRAQLPIATYMVATERLDQDAIVTRSSVSDTRRAGDYYRLSSDGRILWGGRITTRVSARERLGLMLRGDMLSVYPQLGNPRIDFAWAGLMGYALHKMPLIGRDHDGYWFATAFGGHGLNVTAMAGLLIARAIAGDDDAYRRFAVYTPRWAGGAFGRIGVQGSYWWMQLRDRLDETRAQKAE